MAGNNIEKSTCSRNGTALEHQFVRSLGRVPIASGRTQQTGELHGTTSFVGSESDVTPLLRARKTKSKGGVTSVSNPFVMQNIIAVSVVR